MKEPFKLTEGGVTNYAGSGNMIKRIKIRNEYFKSLINCFTFEDT